ncbi:2-iminoacetate synthase ThiH [Planctomycetota bacterium]
MRTDSHIHNVLKGYALTDFSSRWGERLEAVQAADVERELAQVPGRFRLGRLATLVSPAAGGYLEAMAQQSHVLTVQRFGKTVSLYAPLYLSNVCSNRCTYCGFNCDSPTERRRLSLDEAVAEAKIIRGEGFTDLLLVSSEDRTHVSINYLAELAARLRGMFSSLSLEIHQLENEEYRRLLDAGIEGVTLYQETYDRATYARFHLAGPKSDYERRLRAFDDIAGAGMRRVGLGSLLGLADWRLETLALGVHAHALMKRYWRAHVSFSFPRLRPADEVQAEQFDCLLDDRNLVQMVLALRLCFADAGLVLSTRESAQLRKHMLPLGITRMSAGSKTNPGGYGGHSSTGEQFQVDDARPAIEVAEMIRTQGCEPVWKDWDAAFVR